MESFRLATSRTITAAFLTRLSLFRWACAITAAGEMVVGLRTCGSVQRRRRIPSAVVLFHKGVLIAREGNFGPGGCVHLAMHSLQMRFKAAVVMAWVLVAAQVHAQNQTLSGYISDAATGETLIGATVWAESLSQGVASNVYGFYTLTLPADTYAAQGQLLGLRAATILK